MEDNNASRDVDEFSNDGMDVTVEQLENSGERQRQQQFSKEEEQRMLLEGDGEQELAMLGGDQQDQNPFGPEMERALLGSPTGDRDQQPKANVDQTLTPQKSMFGSKPVDQVKQFKFNMYQAPSNRPTQFGGGMDLSLMSSDKSGDSSTLTVDSATLRRRTGGTQRKNGNVMATNGGGVRKRVGTRTDRREMATNAERRKRQSPSAEPGRATGTKNRSDERLGPNKKCQDGGAQATGSEQHQTPPPKPAFSFFSTTAGLLANQKQGRSDKGLNDMNKGEQKRKMNKNVEDGEWVENEDEEEGGEEAEQQSEGEMKQTREENEEDSGGRTGEEENEVENGDEHGGRQRGGQNELREYDAGSEENEDEFFVVYEKKKHIKTEQYDNDDEQQQNKHRSRQMERGQNRQRSQSVRPPSTSNSSSSTIGNSGNTTLFICPIPLTMSEHELQPYFLGFGQIRSLLIGRDPTTGDSRGFGYVSFITEQSAQAAMEQKGRIWPEGAQKPFNLNWYRPKSQYQRLRSISPDMRRGSRATSSHQYQPAGPGSTIYVTGFCPDTPIGQSDVLDRFTRFGPVQKVEIVRAPHHVAYVRFANAVHAARAIKANAGMFWPEAGGQRIQCGWDRREEITINNRGQAPYTPQPQQRNPAQASWKPNFVSPPTAPPKRNFVSPPTVAPQCGRAECRIGSRNHQFNMDNSANGDNNNSPPMPMNQKRQFFVQANFSGQNHHFEPKFVPKNVKWADQKQPQQQPQQQQLYNHQERRKRPIHNFFPTPPTHAPVNAPTRFSGRPTPKKPAETVAEQPPEDVVHINEGGFGGQTRRSARFQQQRAAQFGGHPPLANSSGMPPNSATSSEDDVQMLGAPNKMAQNVTSQNVPKMPENAAGKRSNNNNNRPMMTRKNAGGGASGFGTPGFHPAMTRQPAFGPGCSSSSSPFSPMNARQQHNNKPVVDQKQAGDEPFSSSGNTNDELFQQFLAFLSANGKKQ